MACGINFFVSSVLSGRRGLVTDLFEKPTCKNLNGLFFVLCIGSKGDLRFLLCWGFGQLETNEVFFEE